MQFRGKHHLMHVLNLALRVQHLISDYHEVYSINMFRAINLYK